MHWSCWGQRLLLVCTDIYRCNKTRANKTLLWVGGQKMIYGTSPTDDYFMLHWWRMCSILEVFFQLLYLGVRLWHISSGED